MAILNYATNPNQAYYGAEYDIPNVSSTSYFGWDGQKSNSMFLTKFDPTPTFALTTEFYTGSVNYVDDNRTVLWVTGDGDVNKFLVGIKATGDGYLYLREYLSTGLEVVSPALFRMASGSWCRLDLNVKISDTAGHIRVYVYEKLVYEFVGDTKTALAMADPTAHSINYHAGTTNSSVTWFVRNVIVTDGEDTRGMKITQITPIADGGVAQFEGDYTMVDNLSKDDGTKIFTSNVDQQSRFVLSDQSVNLSSKEILAVGITTRGMVGYGDINSIESSLYDGVNEAVSGKLITTKGYFESTNSVFSTTPSGAAWTPAGLANLQVGVKTKA